MRLMITGGAGFIGSTVIKMAVKNGYEVLNFDSLTYASSLESLASIVSDPNYNFMLGDLRNQNDVEKAILEFQPDQILHLAAETHVDRSIEGPAPFIETNIVGTYNLLERATNYWYSNSRPTSFRFLHISTDEVFGSLSLQDREIKFNESTPYAPRSPYSASKAAADHLVRAWHETFGLPTIITNCSNNFGPFQNPEKLIPLVIFNSILEKSIPIYGDGQNVRDWLFVEDHASALLLVLKAGEIGRSYNIGGNTELTNLDLVTLICDILDKKKPRSSGSYADLIKFVDDRPGHDLRYAIDNTRIKNELGWQPSVCIKTGLIKTVDWYLDNESWLQTQGK